MIYPIHRDIRKMIHGIGVPWQGFPKRRDMRAMFSILREARGLLVTNPPAYAEMVLRGTRRQILSTKRRK